LNGSSGFNDSAGLSQDFRLFVVVSHVSDLISETNVGFFSLSNSFSVTSIVVSGNSFLYSFSDAGLGVFSNDGEYIVIDLVESVWLEVLADRGHSLSFIEGRSVGHVLETLSLEVTGGKVVVSSSDFGVDSVRVTLDVTVLLLTVMSSSRGEVLAYFVGNAVEWSVSSDRLVARKGRVAVFSGSVKDGVTEGSQILISKFRAESHETSHLLVVDDPSFNLLSRVVSNSSHNFTGHLHAVEVSLLDEVQIVSTGSDSVTLISSVLRLSEDSAPSALLLASDKFRLVSSIDEGVVKALVKVAVVEVVLTGGNASLHYVSVSRESARGS